MWEIIIGIIGLLVLVFGIIFLLHHKIILWILIGVAVFLFVVWLIASNSVAERLQKTLDDRKKAKAEKLSSLKKQYDDYLSENSQFFANIGAFSYHEIMQKLAERKSLLENLLQQCKDDRELSFETIKKIKEESPDFSNGADKTYEYDLLEYAEIGDMEIEIANVEKLIKDQKDIWLITNTSNYIESKDELSELILNFKQSFNDVEARIKRLDSKNAEISEQIASCVAAIREKETEKNEQGVFGFFSSVDEQIAKEEKNKKKLESQKDANDKEISVLEQQRNQIERNYEKYANSLKAKKLEYDKKQIAQDTDTSSSFSINADSEKSSKVGDAIQLLEGNILMLITGLKNGKEVTGNHIAALLLKPFEVIEDYKDSVNASQMVRLNQLRSLFDELLHNLQDANSISEAQKCKNMLVKLTA